MNLPTSLTSTCFLLHSNARFNFPDRANKERFERLNVFGGKYDHVLTEMSMRDASDTSQPFEDEDVGYSV